MRANIHTLIRIGPDTRAGKGFTLIEMMVVIAILGILLAIAAPSFTVYFEKYRARRAADTISAFLVNAKSEAVKRNAGVNAVFKITSGGTPWCVGMTTSNTCDCNTSGACQLQSDGVDRVVSSADYRGVLLIGPDTDYAFQFDNVRGTLSTATGETVEIESASGQQVHVVVSPRGRIRLCSPSSAPIGGYPIC